MTRAWKHLNSVLSRGPLAVFFVAGVLRFVFTPNHVKISTARFDLTDGHIPPAR